MSKMTISVESAEDICIRFFELLDSEKYHEAAKLFHPDFAITEEELKERSEEVKQKGINYSSMVIDDYDSGVNILTKKTEYYIFKRHFEDDKKISFSAYVYYSDGVLGINGVEFYKDGKDMAAI